MEGKLWNAIPVVSLAARIFRIGIFMYGKKPTLGEILRWIRCKG